MPDAGPRRVAVLLDHVESDYHVDILEGALRAARSVRARTLVIPGGWLPGPDGAPVVRNFVYDLLQGARVDGLVILAGSLSNYSGLTEFGAWVDRFASLPVVFVGLELEARPSVFVDNEIGMRAAVSHLIGTHQRRRIAFIRGPAESPECEARRRAYQKSLEEHGIELDPRLVVKGGLSREDGAAAVAELFDERRFTPATLNAIVAVNDDVALGALMELTRRSVKVPDPIAVTGFDDAASARAANPPLTTVSQRVAEQAYSAMRILCEHLERGAPLASHTIESELVMRSSCGCTPRFHNASADVQPVRGGMARTCRLALIERRTTVLAELARAAAGRLVGMSGWEARLFDALTHNLSQAAGSTFVSEVEQLVRRNVALGRDVILCHEVLTVLRLQALACAALEPEVRPRVEDLFQESRLTISRIGVDVERERQRALAFRMRLVTKACLSLLGAPNAADLAQLLLEHLPELGIRAFSVAKLTGPPGPGAELELIVRRAEGVSPSGAPTLPGSSLGLDSVLELEEAMLIEPLEFRGEPVGVAALAWGAHDPFHYEQLRELLGAAVHGVDDPGVTPCVISVAITGSVPTKAHNPAVPISVEEQIESTHAAFEAGAALVHIHVRDEQGRPSSDPERFRLVQEGVRRHCPGMIVQFSTGGRGRGLHERGAMLYLNPDMASLATGSVNFPTSVYENPPDFVQDLARDMLERGIKPEVEVFDAAMLYNAAELVKAGLLRAPPHVQFVLGLKQALPARRPLLEFLARELEELLPGATWTAAGIGRHQLEVNRWSLELGGHTRTGLEDNVRFDDQRLAHSNAELVGRVASMTAEYGRSVATTREARNILGLPPAGVS